MKTPISSLTLPSSSGNRSTTKDAQEGTNPGRGASGVADVATTRPAGVWCTDSVTSDLRRPGTLRSDPSVPHSHSPTAIAVYLSSWSSHSGLRSAHGPSRRPSWSSRRPSPSSSTARHRRHRWPAGHHVTPSRVGQSQHHVMSSLPSDVPNQATDAMPTAAAAAWRTTSREVSVRPRAHRLSNDHIATPPETKGAVGRSGGRGRDDGAPPRARARLPRT